MSTLRLISDVLKGIEDVVVVCKISVGKCSEMSRERASVIVDNVVQLVVSKIATVLMVYVFINPNYFI